MSEFFFEYKCIAMSDKGKEKQADKALDFYLFQDDSGDDAMCVQVYVPKQMQKNFCGARVYHRANGIRLPDLSEPEYEFYSCGEVYGKDVAKANISTDNSIFIRGKNGELSGCGVIAFIDGDNPNATPKVENCYKYVINYAKKETITYRIVEHKGSIRVEVIYPLIRKNITLGLIRKAKAKPVLIRDREQVLVDNIPAEIVLKANGRNEDVVKKSFPVDDASKYDYRLIFNEDINNKYFLLVDESDYTIEDMESRKEEIKNKHKIQSTAKKCPYCGEEMPVLPPYKKGMTLIVTCKGETLANFTRDEKLKGKLTIVCGAELTKLSEQSGGRAFIPVNHLVCPNGYEQMPSMNVTVAGFPKSGKTLFLSSLFNMNSSLKSFPFLLDRILKVFGKKGNKKEQMVEEVKYHHVEKKEGAYVLGSTCEDFRNSPMQNIKKRYVMTVNSNVEAQTQYNDGIKLSWHPIGYKIGDMGCVYFYDIPGEMFTEKNKTPVRSMDMADCLLAVIDGAEGAEKALAGLYDSLEKAAELSAKKMDENMPIAIVFTKHDLQLSEYVPDEDIERKKGCFDENCHVVREDIFGMMPSDGVYEGSELERHIDCSSYELEHFLKSAGEESLARVENLKKKYKNVKFFTCSALGSNSRLGESKNLTKEVLFRPRRLRMELPVIWLMYQKGLIKR